MKLSHHACLPLSALFGTLLAVAQPAATGVPIRAQVPEKYRWDLTRMYADTAAWEADFERASKACSELEGRRGQSLDTPEALRATLALRDDTRWLVDKLLVYASQFSDQDTRDNAALGLKSRATTLYVTLGQATAWIEPAVQALPEEHWRAWCDSEPAVRVYRHYLENAARMKPHTLPAREEELLAMSGNLAAVPEETYSVLQNAELPWPTMRDEQGQEITLSSARLDKYLRSPDRRLRRDAFLGAMGAYGHFQNTFAATFNGTVQRDLFYARARGFDSALESVLFPDNLPMSVYTNLVQTAGEHLSLLHHWAALRKKTLGLDELHVYDLYQPLVAQGAPEIAYDDAVATIIAALQPLGPEYGAIVQQAFASRWVDVYETQGKRTGGYSWGSYDTPPYIMVNYNGTPRDMSIVAHELGHSVHSYLTHQHQPKVYGGCDGLTTETAAIVNELLLEDYRLQQAATPAERMRLLNEQIDNLLTTTLRQVLFAEFEYEAHALAQRGEALTAERIGQLYLDTFHKYWGPDLARDPENAVYWARVPHFYMNHYVFRYPLAYCAAVALAENVRAEKPGARDAYLDMLKAGSSEYPLELLRHAGVDLRTPAPIEAALRRFERLTGELESLLAGAK
jgi:oligoendopeptidase F